MARTPGRLLRYISFSGRTRRSAFLPMFGIVLIVLVPLSIAAPPLAALIAVAVILPLATTMTQRLHDVGLSGRWLLPLITIPVLMLTILMLGNSMLTLILMAAIDETISDGDISRACIAAETILAWALGASAVMSCVALCWRGTSGPNLYGDDPRATDVDDRPLR